uniref:VWA domain-containing protein n=1 Tax=Candidatus Desulfatibia profunda TaxID=2841695 RepID=A0A8J6NVD9_9BACT|nr:VWA domain-containing protein [Candidatus Desulfatibia profunda]
MDSGIKEKPLKQLAIADPDLAVAVSKSLAQKAGPVSSEDIALLVDETLWALSAEISFGRAVAEGYAELIGQTSPPMIERYRYLVREFGQKGPTLGRILAMYLSPLCKHGDERLLGHFLDTLDIMLAKGSYTLPDPLEGLAALLNAGDFESASVYLDLLGHTFAQDLSYVQCQHFAHILPRAVLGLAPSRRIWQIQQLDRVIRAGSHLADSLLDGLEEGLSLLSKESLDRFVTLGLEKLARSRKLAAKFLSLKSKLGRDTFAGMQVTVPLSQVRGQLNRYLRARTGLAISVRPLSEIPDVLMQADNRKTLVCSDGKSIYLPAEISEFSQKEENINLYKCLTRLEAGHYEFNTFDFDLEKALERCRRVPGSGSRVPGFEGSNFESDSVRELTSTIQNQKDLSDLERFSQIFPVAALATDLFTVFEHGRIRLLLSRHYPGLVRQAMPLLQREAVRMLRNIKPNQALLVLYLKIALGIAAGGHLDIDTKIRDHTRKVAQHFENMIKIDHTVETCAELVAANYADLAQLLKQTAPSQRLEEIYKPMATPYGRTIRPDLFLSAYRGFEQIAAKLKELLNAKGIRVYKSQIRRHLIAASGAISHDDLQTMIFSPPQNGPAGVLHAQQPIDLSWLDLAKLLGRDTAAPRLSDDATGPVFRYPEWDCNLQDYLSDHVRVLERTIAGFESDFYGKTLQRHSGLVKNIRYAFELLKPEGLVRLRPWIEGDEFDYRALLDFAVDKKAGKIPSDRLYIKHIKQIRDVAVLLLVDLSRSTANTVNGSQMTVLDVEKEAIVLFCEALDVVGDAFAIAGFSGTGRLGVDYFGIKNFDETLNDAVRQRINAMAPQRSTRMGAAIRHATSRLEKVSAKVRLLILLGDGFPNDLDYKQDYAIKDTGKAIFEARSKNIYAQAITVNMASDPKLDDLYGTVRHHVITDVRELPDKLLRIYGGLTRN